MEASLRPRSRPNKAILFVGNALAKARNDVLMDLGQMDKTEDYFSRLPERQKRTKAHLAEMSERRKSRNKRKRAAEAKAAAAAKAAREEEIAEAQARRREFYREKGEKTAKRRKLLLNIA